MDDANRNIEDVDGDGYLDDGLLEGDAEVFQDELEQLDTLEDDLDADA
jgi:hypothetical protein